MIYVVIPAYQPDDKLLKLLEELKNEKGNCEIIVVNDGSYGESLNIVEKAKEYANVINHSKNMGKGRVLKTAFNYIKNSGIKGTVVTADADGQHIIEDIFNVALKVCNSNQLVLGVRQFTKNIPFRSRFGNKLTRLIFRLYTGTKLVDTQTGLRAFSTDLIPFMLNITGDRYEYEMNMITEASKKYILKEVPIQTIYIDDNKSSHFRPIIDGLKIYKQLFKFIVSSAVGFVVDYTIYILAIFILSPVPIFYRLLIANTLARLISSTTNYTINKKLVFKNKNSVTQTGIGYFLLVVLLFISDTGLLYIFHTVFETNIYLVKIIVGLFLFIVSWSTQKFLIFKEKERKKC